MTPTATAFSRSRGVGAARLAAIKNDILENIGSSDLSVGTVAARHAITPRYLHMLFRGEDATFSAFVLAHRLARAHRMLGDPRYVAHKIGAISFDCGFKDLSWFNRTFRQHYGATPSDIREAALKSGAAF